MSIKPQGYGYLERTTWVPPTADLILSSSTGVLSVKDSTNTYALIEFKPRAAADASVADVTLDTVANRTDGYLLELKNQGVSKFYVKYDGTFNGTYNPGFTAGSIVFQGASGLTQDNANLNWADSTDILTLDKTDASYNANRPVLVVNGWTQTVTGAVTASHSVSIAPMTITAGTAQTIDAASSLYISGAPAAAGSATITASRALWVDDGATQLDGTCRVGGTWLVLDGYQVIGGTSSRINTENLRVRAGSGTAEIVVDSEDTGSPRLHFEAIGGGSPSCRIRTSTATDLNFLVNNVARMSMTNAGTATFSGDLVAGSASTDVVLSSTATRTAGNLLQVKNGSTATLTVGYQGTVTVAPTVQTTGSPNAIVLTGAAHTTLTASTEATDVNLNLARTVQFATGALANQRAVRIQAPTYGFVGASTLSTAATLSIDSAPIAGTNATITNRYSLDCVLGTAHFSDYSPILLEQGAASSGSPYVLKAVGAGHITLTAGTEAPDFDINLNREVQFATGALANQRAVKIQAPTYGFVAASTITNASTLYVSGAPAAGTNCTITNAYALHVDAGKTQLDGTLQVGGATTLDTSLSVGTTITATGGLTQLQSLRVSGTGAGAAGIRIDGDPTSGAANAAVLPYAITTVSGGAGTGLSDQQTGSPVADKNVDVWWKVYFNNSTYYIPLFA